MLFILKGMCPLVFVSTYYLCLLHSTAAVVRDISFGFCTKRLTCPAARLIFPMRACWFATGCFCGDGELVGVSDHRECTIPCEYDSKHICGGESHVSVYAIPIPEGAPKQPNLVEIDEGDAELQGCYFIDDNIDEILEDDDPGVAVPMTNEVETYC
ncbi:MAG: hypothetical protein ABJQ90_10835 [Parasphingorhabdus sp.]